ncbi:cupin domain-containing protein [Nocardioides iriomotensis]|nr:cupin domain-containing protein [Nocardioides iriomotensis]
MGKTVVRTEAKGDAYWMLGGLYEVLASSEDTEGTATVMQMTVPVASGPPPHTHPGSESVYVVEGTARVHVNGESHDAGPGAFFHFPAGTLETFEPTSTVKLLITYQPGGIEHFFAEAGERAPRRELPPPPDTPPDLARLVEIGERYGMQIQVPPG